jgi:hypothetical protein
MKRKTDSLEAAMYFARKSVAVILLSSWFFAPLAWADDSPASTQPIAATEPAAPLDQIIPELRCDSMSLETVIETLGEATHANLVVDWAGLEAVNVTKQTSIRLHLWNVPLHTALSVVLQLASDKTAIEFREKDGVVTISTVDGFVDRLTTRFYDIRGLIEAAAEYKMKHPGTLGQLPNGQFVPAPVDSRLIASEYIELITATIDREMGIDADGPMHVSELAGMLVVTTTPRQQKSVDLLLRKWREASAKGHLPIIPPAEPGK